MNSRYELGILVDEMVLSTRYGKTRGSQGVYQQDLINRDHLSINKPLSTETTYQEGLIVGKLG
jgi:hypothetical protein